MGGDERKDGRADKRKSPCVLQDFVPFGAAAQKKIANELKGFKFLQFLVACTRLYNPPCPSVGPSVRPSVTLRSRLAFFGVSGGLGVTAPAQPSSW